MEREKISIFLILTILSYANAQQDLCGEAFAQKSAYANDPGDCTRYIYCERNSTNHLTRIGYGQCDQSSPFKFFKNGACTTDPTLCAPGALCPVSGDYRIAVPSESCFSYRFCKLTTMPITNCAMGLTFDRSSGNCINNTNGFIGSCPSGQLPPPEQTTLPPNPCAGVPDFQYVEDGSCLRWAFCYQGQAYDRGECPCGYVSGNPIQECQIDSTNCNQCTTTANPNAPTTTTSNPNAPTTTSDPNAPSTTIDPNLTTTTTSATPENWCETPYCSPAGSHIACNHNGQFAPSCQDPVQVTLDASQIQEILYTHNKWRNDAAGGNIVGFQGAALPTAIRMAKIQWNDQLAEFAVLNTKQCMMNHDQCRSTSQFQHAGQNLYTGATSDSAVNITALLINGIDNWASESAFTRVSDINTFTSVTGGNGEDIGHFTALVNERMTHVGCALSTYTESGFYWRLLACNYAYTNMVGKPVYQDGTIGSSCTTGTDSVFTNLCTVNEQIDVNAP